MKKAILLFALCFVLALVTSCTTLDNTSRNRTLDLDGIAVNEQDYGGCVRWYATDTYSDDFVKPVYFQVGYFQENEIGFVLYGDGTTGTEAVFEREGLNLRWDWGFDGYYYIYSLIMEPDGTGLYYDFSTSSDGVGKPSSLYKCYKF